MSTTDIAVAAQNGITKHATDLAVRATGHPDIVAAAEAAHYALSIVVSDDASLKQATECSLKLAAGRKALAAGKKPLTAFLSSIKDAIAAPFTSAEKPIADAEAYLLSQELAYRRELERAAEAQRRAAEEARRADEAKRAAAERAIREAEEANRPVPPVAQRIVDTPAPVPVAPPPPVATQTKVDGGSSNVTYSLKVELVKPRECPEYLLVLKTGALDTVRRWIDAGDVVVPKKMEPVMVEFCGLKIWYEPGITKRTR